jgi:hypothetical protein
MSDAVIIAMIVAIPPTLVGLAGLVQSIFNGQKSDAIHLLVNSNMDALKAELKAAVLEIHNLKVAASKPETNG